MDWEGKGTYFAPLEAPVVVDGPVDAEGGAAEPPEGEHDGGDAHPEDDPFRLLGELACCEDEVVEYMREHQHSEVERRELCQSVSELDFAGGRRGTYVVVDIGNTSHNHEWDCAMR